MAAAAAPAPARSSGARELARFGRDPLRYLDGMRGDPRDLVPFTLGRVRCRLVAAPQLVHEVLATEDWPPVSRGRLMALDRWYGGGLILTAGAEHHRQRDELWRPVLDGVDVAGIAVRRAARLVEGWEAGAPVEVFGALRALCWSIDWETLTGGDLTPELLAAQAQGTASAAWLIGPFGTARWDWPLPASMRARAARARLDGALGALVAERRAGTGGGALADLVARERDDALVRATVKQWLGADQIHAWLTWTLYLLATHPETAARWRAELDEALGGRDATGADVARLPLTRQILQESLRLYPPIWGFFRGLTGEYRLGGETLPAGTVLALSQWVTQRDARHWPEPERFDPGRWGDGAERPAPGSYFPFSSGPYGCPAHGHATTVATLVLATIGRRVALEHRGDPPRLLATGVIEPKGGLPLTPVPR